MTAMREDISWLEPYPDALLPATSDPEETLRLHESVRLAFVRAVQVLPPRQRAALILHDVLDFAVSDVAAMLETTAPAINSALPRARASLERAPSDRDGETSAAAHECIEVRKAETVARFVRAWETGDFGELVSMLTEDADPHDAAVGVLARRSRGRRRDDGEPRDVGGEPRPGRYRVVPCGMNGQPAALAYVRFGDGPCRP